MLNNMNQVNLDAATRMRIYITARCVEIHVSLVLSPCKYTAVTQGKLEKQTRGETRLLICVLPRGQQTLPLGHTDTQKIPYSLSPLSMSQSLSSTVDVLI